LTFTPHPRRFFSPEMPPDRLCDDFQKQQFLKQAGADFVAFEKFDTALASMVPDEFVRDVLVEKYNPAAVIVGYNFHFGKGRSGSPQTMHDLGRTYGFETIVQDEIADPSGTISSTRIRDLIRTGALDDAAKLLGRPFTISGPVLHGDKRGREIGYPTANQDMGLYVRPPFGIYAVRATIQGGETHNGVANLGIRPMFRIEQPLLESFLFDFDGDLYNQRLHVSLVAHLRDEKKFASLDALVLQMDQDSQMARRLLKG